MAKGRNFNSFLSRTSSGTRRIRNSKVTSETFSRLSTLQFNTMGGSAPSFNSRIVTCVMSVVCTLSPLCGTPKILVLGIKSICIVDRSPASYVDCFLRYCAQRRRCESICRLLVSSSAFFTSEWSRLNKMKPVVFSAPLSKDQELYLIFLSLYSFCIKPMIGVHFVTTEFSPESDGPIPTFWDLGDHWDFNFRLSLYLSSSVGVTLAASQSLCHIGHSPSAESSFRWHDSIHHTHQTTTQPHPDFRIESTSPGYYSDSGSGAQECRRNLCSAASENGGVSTRNSAVP